MAKSRSGAQKRDRQLQALGLRPPKCLDCNAKPVGALGRRCAECAKAAARKDGIGVVVNIKRNPKVKAEEPLPRRDPNEVLVPETVARIIGRDMRTLRIVVAELGIELVDGRGSVAGYRVSDVDRLKAELKVRAAAWTRGERARAW